MQLRRVRVRNIRSYESAQVAFPPGTTLLSGDVGAGKTSLLYAIEMALFGVAEVEAAYLVRHGAAHAEVEVEFDDGEHRYAIVRKFRRVRRKGKPGIEPESIAFSADGAKTAYSATELRQRVIELLGFPDNPNPQAHSDLWRWAVYVPQERMRDILAAKPQDRLETVRKALGVERYRTAAENAQELAADLRRSVVQRRVQAERLKHHDAEYADWNREADRLHAERARLEGSLRGLAVERERRAAELATAEEAVRRTASDRRLKESLEAEQASDARARTEQARVRAERLEEIRRREALAEAARPGASELPNRRERLAAADRDLAARRQALDRTIADLHELVRARALRSAAERQAADAEEAVRRTGQEAVEAERARDAARKEAPVREPPEPTPRTAAEISTALDAARGREAEALTALARTQSELAGLDRLLSAGTCPTCGQSVRAEEFGAHREEAAANYGRAQALHRETVAARERLEEERGSRERYERAHERFVEVEKRRALADVALLRTRESVDRARAGRREAEELLAGARARVDQLAPGEEEERRLRGALAAAVAEREGLAAAEQQASQAARELASATAALETLRSELERLDRDAALVRARSESRGLRLDELARALADAPDGTRALGEARDRLARSEEALRAETDLSVRTETRLDEAARRLRDAERGRSERTHLLAEAEEVERKAQWVSGPFRLAVLTMEQKLLAHAQGAFERNFARYFASLVDDPGLIARTDVAFTPAVTIDGEWTPAEALSGGERTSLALAFRLALTQVVRSLGDLNLETILLDEPTDGFSPEQVVRMGELLDELALPQVIVVSHESELAAIADRVVRVTKHDGRSSVAGPSVPEAAPSTEPAEAETVSAPTRRSRRPSPPVARSEGAAAPENAADGAGADRAPT